MINPILFFICHLVGDFWLQSDWMALNKPKPGWEGFFACLVHVLIYTSVFFIVFNPSWWALLLIGGSHFILDRWPIIIKRMIWCKNHFHFDPKVTYPEFGWCNTTGYYDDSPYNTYNKVSVLNDPTEKYGKPRHFFITIWLYIISDNTLHLIFNYVALSLL